MGYLCTECGAKFSFDRPRWRCDCGGILDIEYETKFPIDEIEKRALNMWRYREAIPIVDDRNIVSFSEGFTPLLTIDEDRGLRYKLEFLFPTGSFKDRGASVLVSRLKEAGVGKVKEDSSGNAGAALAAYCARGGMECTIYAPEKTKKNKLAQIEGFGAKVERIPGPRRAAADVVLGAGEDRYYASHALDPFYLQGTKTFAYEVCEQLGWGAPKTVILPLGGGSLLLGAHIGFSDLKKAGIINRMPRLVGVQAENVAPLYRAFEKGSDEPAEIEARQTIAQGIAISKPRRGGQVLEAVRATGGQVLAVSEAEIKQAHEQAARNGFFVEPTSAVALAGLEQVDGDDVVVPLTGHGLKAV